MILITVLILHLFQVSQIQTYPNNIDSYINRKIRDTSHDGNQSNIAALDLIGKVSDIRTVDSIHGDYSFGNIVAFGTTTLLVLPTGISAISEDRSQGTELVRFSAESHVQSVKAQEFHGFGIVVVRFDNAVCEVYKFDIANIKIMKFQNIQLASQDPESSSLFELNSKLYWAVGNWIYEWKDTYFDQTETDLRQNHVILGSFSLDYAEMIFTRESNSRIGSTVLLEFSEYGSLTLFQHISNVRDLKHVISYTYNNQTWIALFEGQTTKIYKWQDDGMVLTSCSNLIKTSSNQWKSFKSSSLLALTHIENIVTVYELSDKISLKTSIEFSNFSTLLDYRIRKNEVQVLFRTDDDVKLATFDVLFEDPTLGAAEEKTVHHQLEKCFTTIEKKLTTPQDYMNCRPFNTKSKRQSTVDLEAKVTKVTVVDGKLILHNNLHVRNLEVNKSTFFKALNGRAWTPSAWLSKSSQQIILGPVIVDKLITEKVHLANNRPFLQLHNNTHVTSSVVLKSLTTNSLKAHAINGIDVSDIYSKKSVSKVRGVKQLKNLFTESLDVQSINRVPTEEILKNFADNESRRYDFDHNFHVKSLDVIQLNGIDWEVFYHEAFKIGIDTTINGNVEFGKIKTDRLEAHKLSGIDVDLFLDTASEQTIQSNVRVTSIDAQEIIAKRINEVSTSKFVVIQDNVTTIPGPVQMKSLKVNNVDVSNFQKDLADGDRILGTNKIDLQQIYKQKVEIDGDLYVDDLVVLKGAKVVVNGQPFNENVTSQYWQKNKDQKINVHVEFQKSLRMPTLFAGRLNDKSIGQFMLGNATVLNQNRLYFKKVIVNGNLLSDNELVCEKLARDAVRTTGDYTFTGRKIFQGNVKVENVNALSLNGVSVDLIATKTNLGGRPRFKTLIFEDELEVDELQTDIINRVIVADIFKAAVRIDEDFNMNVLDAQSVKVNNLQLETLNGEHFNQYISQLDVIFKLDHLERVIAKRAFAPSLVGVETINGLPFQQLVDQQTLHGDYKFLDTLHIKDLKVRNVNDIDMEKLLANILYRHWAQEVHGVHEFNTLITDNLVTRFINDLDTNKFVDRDSGEVQNLYLAGKPVVLTNKEFGGSVTSARMTPDIRQCAYGLRNEPARRWASVSVAQDVILMDHQHELMELLERCVRRSGAKHDITGEEITFESFEANKVVINRRVNGLNMTQLMADVIWKDQADQVISGRKQFIDLTATSAVSYANVAIPFINDIEIRPVYKAVVRKDALHTIPIRGHKTFFNGLSVHHFLSEAIWEILPKDMVSVDNLQLVPSLKINKLSVTNNLNIVYLNGVDFVNFLNNRLLLNGLRQSVEAVAYIQHLVVLGPSTTLSAINGVGIDDVITDDDNVIIESAKTFTKPASFVDIFVATVNAQDLSAMYNKAVFVNDTVIELDHVTFNKNVQAKQAIYGKSINGLAMNDINSLAQSSSLIMKSKALQDVFNQIRDRLTYVLHNTKRKPSKLLYLDRSTELQIALPNTRNARVSKIKGGDIQLSVDSDLPGSLCHLPDHCRCPSEQTFYVSPQYSVNILESLNSQSERVFSYSSDRIYVTVVTSSVSSASDCRADNITSESTYVTWTVNGGNASQPVTYNSKVAITGFIENVIYFEHQYQLYIFVVQSYDLHAGEEGASSMLLKFTSNMKEIQLLQKLPPLKSAKMLVSVDLMHLVTIGVDVGNDTEIIVYNFNQDMFHLMRHFTYRTCSQTETVTVKQSMFIMFTCRAAVTIYKYQVGVDNYVLDQILYTPYVSSLLVIPAIENIEPMLLVNNNNSRSLYRFSHLGGFVLAYQEELKLASPVTAAVPFRLNGKHFLFCTSSNESFVLKMVYRR